MLAFNLAEKISWSKQKNCWERHVGEVCKKKKKKKMVSLEFHSRHEKLWFYCGLARVTHCNSIIDWKKVKNSWTSYAGFFSFVSFYFICFCSSLCYILIHCVLGFLTTYFHLVHSSGTIQFMESKVMLFFFVLQYLTSFHWAVKTIVTSILRSCPQLINQESLMSPFLYSWLPCWYFDCK